MLIRKGFLLTALILGVFLLAIGCAADNGVHEENDEEESLPSEIEAWVEYSRDLFLAQDREHDGTLYLLVTYGSQPSGGYSVEITNINEGDDKVTVTVNFTRPAEGDQVTDAVTRPYDLKELETGGLPVEFVATGDEPYIPTLLGLDVLPPIVAQSDGIKVFSPASEAVVSREFDLEGIANVFEGTVLYLLSDSEGKELYSGIACGAMGDWGYFSVNLTLPDEVKSGEELLLKLYTESPKDSSVENLIVLDLVFE